MSGLTFVPVKMIRLAAIVGLALHLVGCLEVEQHPHRKNGQYDGKPDNLAPQTHFHGDRLAWYAALANRNHLQNEYERTVP